MLVAALLALTVAVLVVSISVAMGFAGPLTQHTLVANVFSEVDQDSFERALVPRTLAGEGEELRAPKSAEVTEEPREARGAVPTQGGSEEKAPSEEPAGQRQHGVSTEQKSAGSQVQPREHRAPVTVAVPDLAGMTVAEAKMALAEIGLILRVASYANSRTVPEGIVLSQDTAPGYQARPGATVGVTVSSGLPPEPEDVVPADLPEVKMPEIKTPKVEVPEVEIPDVKVP